MRGKLLNKAHEQADRAERRGSERRARTRRAGERHRRAVEALRRPSGGQAATAPRPAAEPAGGAEPLHSCDAAAEKVRRAGGPCDRAIYTCGCGYLFSAEVSTSVSCPNCGAGQAW